MRSVDSPRWRGQSRPPFRPLTRAQRVDWGIDAYLVGDGSWPSRSMQECAYWEDFDSEGAFLPCSFIFVLQCHVQCFFRQRHVLNHCVMEQDEETALPKLFYSKVCCYSDNLYNYQCVLMMLIVSSRHSLALCPAPRSYARCAPIRAYSFQI